jgi:uncharacterized protein (DUF2141 family)
MKARTVLSAVAAAAAVLTAAPALAAEACAGNEAPGLARLAVEVHGAKPIRGEVAVTVYPNNRKRFLAPGGKLARQRVKTAAVTTACFWLPPGQYAVAVYHDANGNEDFDRTLVGLPAEGFGFSNDAPTRIGLPPLESVRFRLAAGDPPMKIQMRYMR